MTIRAATPFGVEYRPSPDVGMDLACAGRRIWQIAGRPKSIRVIDPGNGRVLRQIDPEPTSRT